MCRRLIVTEISVVGLDPTWPLHCGRKMSVGASFEDCTYFTSELGRINADQILSAAANAYGEVEITTS